MVINHIKIQNLHWINLGTTLIERKTLKVSKLIKQAIFSVSLNLLKVEIGIMLNN